MALKDYKELTPIQQKFVKTVVVIKVFVVLLAVAILWYFMKVVM